MVRSRKFNPKRFRGGRVIAEGGQGCIFWPTIDSHDTKRVSKVMRDDFAREEFEISQKLSMIDAKGQYGIYANGRLNCDIDYDILYHEGIQNWKQEGTCREIEINTWPENAKRGILYCELTYPKYDQDLTTKPPIGRTEVLAGFRNLVNGLYVYHESGFYHGDIKAPNIALQNGTFKFADWGWSADFNSMSANDIDDFLQDIVYIADYSPAEFGGNGGGPWAPILYKDPSVFISKENELRALFYNDWFSLTIFIYYFCKEFVSNSSNIQHKCHEFLSNQGAWTKSSPQSMKTYLMEALHEESTNIVSKLSKWLSRSRR